MAEIVVRPGSRMGNNEKMNPRAGMVNENMDMQPRMTNESMDTRPRRDMMDEGRMDTERLEMRERIHVNPNSGNMGNAVERSAKTRNELLHDIQTANFAAIDLQLYLNTHPDDTDILTLYRTIVKRLQSLIKEFEASYGPLTPMGDDGKNEWTWIKSPWPWE